MHLSVGAGLSAAAGILGRAAEADIRGGSGGYAACYTYSCSKGQISVPNKLVIGFISLHSFVALQFIKPVGTISNSTFSNQAGSSFDCTGKTPSYWPCAFLPP